MMQKHFLLYLSSVFFCKVFEGVVKVFEIPQVESHYIQVKYYLLKSLFSNKQSKIFLFLILERPTHII